MALDNYELDSSGGHNDATFTCCKWI